MITPVHCSWNGMTHHSSQLGPGSILMDQVSCFRCLNHIEHKFLGFDHKLVSRGRGVGIISGFFGLLQMIQTGTSQVPPMLVIFRARPRSCPAGSAVVWDVQQVRRGGDPDLDTGRPRAISSWGCTTWVPGFSDEHVTPDKPLQFIE